MDKHLILSPHLDDAWFDLGGSIAQWRMARELVSIINVFSAQGWMRSVNLPWDLVTSIRKKEEEKNAQSQRVCVEYLDLPEGLLRGYKLIFPQTINWSKDRVVLLKILKSLSKKVEFRNANWVYFPIGIGGNVDHLLLREVAVALTGAIFSSGSRLAFFEDLPYAATHELPSDFIKKMALRPMLKEIDLDQKIGFIRTYESQIDESIVTDIRQYAFSLGEDGRAYERIWVCELDAVKTVED